MECKRCQLNDLPAVELLLRKHKLVQSTDQLMTIFFENEVSLIFTQRSQNSSNNNNNDINAVFGFISLSHANEEWLEMEMYAADDMVQTAFFYQAFSNIFLSMPTVKSVRCHNKSILPTTKTPNDKQFFDVKDNCKQ